MIVKVLNNIRLKAVWVKLFLVLFYVVGVLGLLIPATHSLMVKMIPGALILSALLLIGFHVGDNDKRLIGLLLLIFIFSFAVEVIGVNTGFVFGIYKYGNALGIKLLNTPVIIGLNWVLLVYLTFSIASRWTTIRWKVVVLASLMMVCYDLVLEQVAPDIDMWYWPYRAPLQNYIAWLALALIFNGLLSWFKVKINNVLALTVFVCQFLFFITLLIYSKI